MPNSISGVSSTALARPRFRIKIGESYRFRTTVGEILYLDKLMVNDGTDYAIVSALRVTGPTVDNASYCAELGLGSPPDYDTDDLIKPYGQRADPTYVNSGGLDRRELDWFNTLQLPLLGALSVDPDNCTAEVLLLLGSSRYLNLARYSLGGRVLVGDSIQVQGNVGTYHRATYTDNTVGEVDVSKMDLGAVKTIKKFATRVAYLITGAVAGSSVKCYSSEDDVEWTEIWSKTDLPIVETEEYIEVEDITARYIKFTLDANSAVETATLYQYPLFSWVE